MYGCVGGSSEKYIGGKMKPLISVIVPIYNGAQYLDNLFNQFKRQSYKNLEVILVNDGSKDNSSEIIKKHLNEALLSPIKYRYIEKKNEGQGAARNTGIDLSNGKFISFVDQDDSFKDDYFEKLGTIAETKKIDILLTGFETFDFNGVKDRVYVNNCEWGKFINVSPWGKLYAKEYIDKINARFLEVPLGEDIYFNLYCYSHKPLIYYSDYIGYQWRVNENSFSHTNYISVSEDATVIKLFDALLKMDTWNEWIKDYEYQYFLLKTGIYHILFAAKSTEYKRLVEYKNEVFDWLNKHVCKIERNPLLFKNKPQGERKALIAIVRIYMILRKMKLENIFLYIFRII